MLTIMMMGIKLRSKAFCFKPALCGLFLFSLFVLLLLVTLSITALLQNGGVRRGGAACCVRIGRCRPCQILSATTKCILRRDVFGVAEWRAACESAAAGYKASLGAYRDILNNLSEGTRFYMSLQEAVTGLQQTCGDFVVSRRIEQSDYKQVCGLPSTNALCSFHHDMIEERCVAMYCGNFTVRHCIKLHQAVPLHT
jgi:hypothetical protein